MTTLRHLAWEILRSGSEQPLREVDHAAAAWELEPRDRGLLRRIIGTEVRRRGTLRAVVQRFTHGSPKADLAAHLRIGLAQLLFLDKVPPHAAISETVSAARDTLGLSKGRIVNGVLREVQRQLEPGVSGDPRCDLPGRDLHFRDPLFRDPGEHPSLWAEDALNIPSHLHKRWSKRHGEETAQSLGRWFLEEPPLVVHGANAEDAEALAAAGASAQEAGSWRLPSDRARELFELEGFRAGRLFVQGETAARATALASTGPDTRALDLCAAPGTKALGLAAGGAWVVAADRSSHRLSRMPAELERRGLTGRVQPVACSAGEGLAVDARFDSVLVDAPCSNTGVLGARPGARWRLGPASLRELADLQAGLLESAASRVLPGGVLVWSVCSLEPEEGDQRVRAFLREHPEFELAETFTALPGPGGPVDGGHASRLVRRA
jgi:16S rRNA (cytosine967-C5)-methyltransferase